LLRRYSEDQLQRLVDGAAAALGDQYAPRIADFSSLQAKVPDLLAWGRKRQSTSKVSDIVAIMAIIIPAITDRQCEKREINKHELYDYQQIVGGTVDAVELTNPPAAIYINDEGKINNMPPNHRATAVLWMHNENFRGKDIIIGDVLIIGPPDDVGDDTDAPESLLKLLVESKLFS
jgi:hypothetical protein